MNDTELACELRQLQAPLNQGRGVSCVRTVCLFLERGDRGSARAVILNESDKIRSYPEIVAVLRREGLWPEIDWSRLNV